MSEHQQKYNICKYLIKKCFNINLSIPKGYGTRSAEYDKFYNKKDEILRKVIADISKYQIPIKYGIGKTINHYGSPSTITYFCFEGRQYSFHGYYGTGKKYNGKWIGRRRTNFECRGNSIIGSKDCY